MKISQLYGMQIISADKKKSGYILGISCVKGMIEGYICCNESENLFFADCDGAKICGDKMVVLSTGKAGKKEGNLRLGGAVFSERGKFLGRVDDFGVKANRVTHAIVSGKKYPYDRLVFGDAVILKNEKPLAEIAAKDMFISAVCDGGEEITSRT